MKEMRVPEIKQHQIQHQPQIQEIQIQRPEAHPLIIANVLNQQPTMLNSGQHQLIQTANGQIIQAQIGQFIQGPNNTIQMITASPSVTQQPQLLQLRSEPENRCELIVQPQEINDSHYFDEIPVVVQSANGQQTILNLPHHHVQALQAQIASQSTSHHQQQQQHQQVQIQQMTTSSQPTVESNEIEVHEVHEIQDGDYEQMDEENYICEDMEEVLEDADESTTYIVETVQEEDSSENSDMDDKLLNDFLAQQTHSQPGKHVCNLCNQEFKHVKWLNSHMKSIHINWIKANCKKQPQCSICHKSFRGPGMLKMHMKTHEKENKLPTCTICSKEFKSKSILYRHRATHFNTQKEHRCTICDKTFSSAYQLNAHIQRHQKNIPCKQCDKTFPTSVALKVNARTFASGEIFQHKFLF